jgi:hypothetical protein
MDGILVGTLAGYKLVFGYRMVLKLNLYAARRITAAVNAFPL